MRRAVKLAARAFGWNRRALVATTLLGLAGGRPR
jgi:hypothetical protein